MKTEILKRIEDEVLFCINPSEKQLITLFIRDTLWDDFALEVDDLKYPSVEDKMPIFNKDVRTIHLSGSKITTFGTNEAVTCIKWTDCIYERMDFLGYTYNKKEDREKILN